MTERYKGYRMPKSIIGYAIRYMKAHCKAHDGLYNALNSSVVLLNYIV
jgi:hypothetical protein